MSNVSLIFNAIKGPVSYSWCHYAEHPEMKKYLVHEKGENGYRLRDTRTNQIVLEASMSLAHFLK